MEPSAYGIYRQTHDWPRPLPEEPTATVSGACEWSDREAPAGARVDYVVAPMDPATGQRIDSLAGLVVVRTDADETAPAPPSLRSAIDVPYDAGGAIAIEFQALSDDDNHGARDVVRYALYRSTSPPGAGEGGEPVDEAPSGSMGFIDRKAADGTAYYYWATAVDGTNESRPSNVVGPVASRANPTDKLWSLLRSALAIVLTLGVAVSVHELGHMQMAKAMRMRVDEFAIGFGRKLFGWHRSGTDYSVRLLPAGGYVRIRGMVPEEVDDPEGFYARPALARAAVLVAGAAMNVVLALVIYAVVVSAYSAGTLPIVEMVKPGGPAEAAGLERGDIIRSVDGVVYSRDLFAVGAISRSAGRPVRLEILRDGQPMSVTAVPEPEDAGGNMERALYGLGKSKARGMIGVSMSQRPYEAPPARGLRESLAASGRCLRDDTVALLRLLGQLVTGQVGVKGTVGGPIAIVQGVHAAQEAGLHPLLALVAYLNVTLAVVNLLPFPMFDGSRVVLTLLEGVRGKLFDKEKEAMFHLAGVVLLLVFVVFISWMDIGRIVGGG